MWGPDNKAGPTFPFVLRLKRGLEQGRRGAYAGAGQGDTVALSSRERSRERASLGKGTPEKQGHVHDISSHLLAAAAGLQGAQPVHSNLHVVPCIPHSAASKCTDLNLFWILRKQPDGVPAMGQGQADALQGYQGLLKAEKPAGVGVGGPACAICSPWPWSEADPNDR